MKEFALAELGKRIGQLLVSLFVLLVVTFVIGRILPTDPVGAIVGELADPAAYRAMRERLGLDLPVYQQFWIYFTSLLRGDMGTAILTGNPVAQDLSQAFPATFELATLAIIISTVIGVPLGMAAAFFRDSWVDQFVRVISLVGHSIPVFWFGVVGLVFFYGTRSEKDATFVLKCLLVSWVVSHFVAVLDAFGRGVGPGRWWEHGNG
jgi:peptide/nickel transport system permease protein